MKHQNTTNNATVNAQNTNNGKENAMTRTAIMEKLDRMGVTYKKKDSLQTLKDILENELNARFYAKYGTPKENAMEKEAEKLMNNLIQSLTKNNNAQKEENTMTTENTNSAPVNTETKKEEKTMTKTEQRRKEAEARKQERLAKKAEKERKFAEKKAEKKAKQDDISALLDFIVTTWENEYGTVEVASYEAKTSFAALKTNNRQVIKVVFSSTSVRLAFRVDVRDIFEDVKMVNYVMPYQTVLKTNSDDLHARILKSFAFAVANDVKKPRKKAEKKETEQNEQ